MKDEMSPRQRRAWTFAAATVPAVMVCAGRSWHWVLIGSAGAAGYYLILYFLRRTGGMTLAESYQAGFGRITGRIVLILTAGWTLLTLANAATGAAAAFPGEEARLAPAAVLLLAGLACRRGTDVPARCAAVAAPVLAGLYAVLLLAAAPGVHGAWCRPWGTPTAAAEAAAAMLLPTTGLLLAGKEHEEQVPAGPLAVMLLGTALMALLTAGYFVLVFAGRTKHRVGRTVQRPNSIPHTCPRFFGERWPMDAAQTDFYARLAHAIAVQFGSNCEVVVHDLETKDPEKSIIAIENGHVTGRSVGDGPSHIVLDAVTQYKVCAGPRS